MGLAKKIGIVVLLYVIFGILWVSGRFGWFFFIPGNNAIYTVFDIFFYPVFYILILLFPGLFIFELI